jgi:hypothetical protein
MGRRTRIIFAFWRLRGKHGTLDPMTRLCAIAMLLGLAAIARAETPGDSVRAACKSEPGVHRLVMPPPPLDWNDVERALYLRLGEALYFDDGNVMLYRSNGDEDFGLAPLHMPVEQGAALIKAREREKLAAVFYYELASSRVTDGPCFSPSGGRFLKVGFRPVRLELFDRGAEANAGARPVAVFRTVGAEAAEHATPRVVLGPFAMTRRADEAQRGAVEKELATFEPVLRRCYEGVLTRYPEADGRLVFHIVVEHNRFRVQRVELDSVGNQTLTQCARAALESAVISARVSELSLGIGFERK